MEYDLDSVLGYSASVGYKMDLNDTFYLRPQVGFAGASKFGEVGATLLNTTVIDVKESNKRNYKN